MKGMDVVAMPSRWEACGLLAMEALTAGVPIVGTNCIGLREVLSGSPARMVSPGDNEALAALLHEELEQPRHEEFRAYANIAARRFSAAGSAQTVRSLYEDLRSSRSVAD